MPSTDAARRELIQKAILNSLTHAKGTITRIESKGVVSWQIHQAARALPIAAEIDRRLAAHCETYDGVGLIAVTHAAVVFAPCSFTRVTDEISTGNVVVVVAELSTAQAREIRPNAIGASAIDAEADLVIDPLHGETGVQLVPCRAFIRMNSGPMDDALSDCWQRLLFGAKYLGQRATIALAHHQDNLPLARLVLSKPSVDRISGKILWPDMTAEISSVDFRGVSLATDTQRLDAGGHRLAQFVCQNKGRLVLHIELTTEGKHTVALHLITKDDGREQVNSQWQLVLGEQCARCDRKVFSARLAAPSRWTRGSRTGITNLAATAGTNWFTVGLRPAQAQKYVIDLTIRHKHNLGSTKRARRRGKQKMLSHNHLQTERYPNPLLPEALKKYNPLFAGGGCYITIPGLAALLRE